ncbi:hypothetical protein WJX72_001350 [[Myrmecia] bisecta]|uniref:Cdc23 domain-containing protein n=1 Tax=[Myrmecia] bisecta TaxID=41462 RepID=A0AAW1Q0J4_9CHLO
MDPVAPASTAAQKRAELRRAVVDLRARGLYSSAKWAAEQLAGLPEAEGKPPPRTRRSRSDIATADEEDDLHVLAKSAFDVKDYRRAAHVLRDCTFGRSFFLRCYAAYLAGEKRKEEERVETSGPLGCGNACNKDLDVLEAELCAACQGGNPDSFIAYLYGLVLADRERKSEARALLLASISGYPCHWGAWQALQQLCVDCDVQAGLSLPRHWMREFFLVSLCLESQQNEEGLGRLQTLEQQFPRSDWVVAQAATAQYNLRNFDEAQDLFEVLLERDPHRIEGMDTYSNILYVKEQFAALSHLAHRTAVTDKFCPETCCIIGNYYSLKGQHEKAVLYFRRALKLNRHYLSAWTLMGHEYVEMKNPPAAIDAYRRAVDLNPRDYRAWYGLGQTYELLHMPYYALYYFRRATQLRPHDARMWCAMGQCYENEQLAMYEKAIRCYRRAEQNVDREGIALHKLAKLHDALGQRTEAAYYFEQNLGRIDAERIQGSDTLDALAFLASYKKDMGQLQEAEVYCLRLLDYGAPSKEKAKALLREIRSMQQHAGFSSPSARSMSPDSPSTSPV